MRKMIMMAVLAAAATTAFAQEDLVKQAKKLMDKGQLEQALQTLKPALDNGTDQEKAAAWNLLSAIQYETFSKNQDIQLQNQITKANTPIDTLAMNKAIVESFESAIKCDEYDSKPNEKGKIKPKFRSANSTKFFNARPNTINAGMYFYNKRNLPEAIRAWKLYVDSKDMSLFKGQDFSKDQYASEVSYYVGLAAYNEKDYATATKYAKIAAQDTAKAKDANEILLFAQKDGCKTKEDSVAYLNTVKDLHNQYPSDDRYYNLLLDYYSKPGREADKLAWVESELAKDPNNKMNWAVKGEALMGQQKWDEAIEAYKKATAIDPSFVLVVYNIGSCYFQKAAALSDQLADKRTGSLSPANSAKVQALLKEAATYMEKTRELDPNREKVNWAYSLYQIYYSLKDPKAKELESLVNGK